MCWVWFAKFVQKTVSPIRLNQLSLTPISKSSTYPLQVSSRDVYPHRHKPPTPRSSLRNDLWRYMLPPFGTQTSPPRGVDFLPSVSQIDQVLAIDFAVSRSPPTRHMIGSLKNTRMTAPTGDEDSRPVYYSCINILNGLWLTSFALSDRTNHRRPRPRHLSFVFRKYSSLS